MWPCVLPMLFCLTCVILIIHTPCDIVFYPCYFGLFLLFCLTCDFDHTYVTLCLAFVILISSCDSPVLCCLTCVILALLFDLVLPLWSVLICSCDLLSCLCYVDLSMWFWCCLRILCLTCVILILPWDLLCISRTRKEEGREEWAQVTEFIWPSGWRAGVPGGVSPAQEEQALVQLQGEG